MYLNGLYKYFAYKKYKMYFYKPLCTSNCLFCRDVHYQSEVCDTAI